MVQVLALFNLTLGGSIALLFSITRFMYSSCKLGALTMPFQVLALQVYVLNAKEQKGQHPLPKHICPSLIFTGAWIDG